MKFRIISIRRNNILQKSFYLGKEYRVMVETEDKKNVTLNCYGDDHNGKFDKSQLIYSIENGLRKKFKMYQKKVQKEIKLIENKEFEVD